jgi:hypothetical protein
VVVLMLIASDLTDEQRKTYAGKADQLASCATQLAGALRGADDQDVLVCMALTAMSGMFITDLRVPFDKAVHVDIPGCPEC